MNERNGVVMLSHARTCVITTSIRVEFCISAKRRLRGDCLFTRKQVFVYAEMV